MSETVHYRIYCETDTKWEKWRLGEEEATPTVCPVDSAHTVTANSVAETHRTGPKQVTLGSPKTADNRPIFAVAAFMGNVNPQYPGIGDDVAAGTRGTGQAFIIDETTSGDHTLDFQFIDTLYMFAGEAYTYNGVSGDEVTFDMIFPGTTAPASNPGLGNCNLVSVTGGNVVIPAAGDGSHDVDITTALNANLDDKAAGCPTKVTQATPVPAYDDDGLPNGYWDWDETTGAITASATPGSAMWNLFDFTMTKVRWVPHMQLADPGQNSRTLTIEVSTKAKKILPHWIFRVTLHKIDAVREIHLDWFLKIARKEMV